MTMKKCLTIATVTIIYIIMTGSCKNNNKGAQRNPDFNYQVDRFEDIRVLRYQLPGFNSLSLKEKEFIYFLSEAALCGRDIQWDQNFKYNLLVRKTIEGILSAYNGDKSSNEYKSFMTYAKIVFFANGIHHHYSNDKFVPGFSSEFFASLVNATDESSLPLAEGEKKSDLIKKLTPVLFDGKLYAKKLNTADSCDIVASSAVNFYDGVTQKEVTGYYASLADPDDQSPVSWGLNSKVVRQGGKVTEIPYKSGGMYGPAIDKIIYWLDKARQAALSEEQAKALDLLIEYYKTGNLKTWDEYNILWAGDTEDPVDYINGFIETYNDPLGMKANWESIVEYRDIEATKRTAIITANAQWFEDNSPVNPAYRKTKVTGIAASVINVAMLGGDSYPASPLGVNLPNADWIREKAGSKSVSLANITNAIDIASQGNGMLEEFAYDQTEIDRARKFASLANALHTDFHECIGHASGRLAQGTDPNALQNYGSALEEARADLFALYYLMDKKVISLGLVPSDEVGKAEYDNFIRNGLLTQIVRIKPGKNIEQAHMRDRAAIAHWVYENGKAGNVIEVVKRDNKTFVRINDYQKLRELFGKLLSEIQRIKSEGDYEAGKALIENYGVKIDPALHKEVLERYSKLDLAPYTGFVNPTLTPVTDGNGIITDIKVEYCSDYLLQMMEYGKKYSFLPVKN
jgi:dipeptidyl-peptidase III